MLTNVETLVGLYVYSDSTYYSLNKTYDFLSHNIMAICFDRNGNAMVGSNNGEVYFLDYQNDSLMHYYTLSSKNGLHGNTIRWLEMGSENDLWIGTEKGINVLNSDSIFLNVIPVICFFDHEEGFSDYTGNNAATDRNGNIWVGTDHRLIRIDAKNRYRFFTYNTEVNISEIYFINSKSRSNLNLLLDNFPEDIPYKDSYF